MMRVFQADVKRIDFDGTRTLHIVFYSRTAANRWVKKTLRFQKPVITLNDTARGPGENTTGTYTPDQLELQYAVRVYDAEKLGLVALSRAMHRFVGAPVLDVEYARAVKTDIYDNRYYTVKFAQVECPEDLNDVTRIEMGSHCITIHHYQTQLRRPCGRCWSPRHGKRKCTVAEGKVVHVRNRYTRVFDGEISKVATSTRANFAADCVETLVGMVKAMQDATSQRVPERLKRRMECLEQPTSESDDREEINSVANATASTAHTQVASSVGTDAQKALVDAAGYIVHRSKGFKQAANKSRRGQLSGAVELKGVKATRDDSTQLVPQGKAATADFTQPGLPRMEAQQRKDGGTRKGTHASKTKASSTKSSARLTAFQREEAREYYEALADTEESDDADNSDSDNELGRDTDMGMDSDGATNERLALPDRDGPMHPCGDRDMGEVGERLNSGIDDSLTLMPPPKVQPAPVTKRTAVTVASSMLNKQHGAVGLADQAEMRREDDIAKTASATKERRRRRHDANRNGLGDNGDTFEQKNGLVQTSLAQYMKTGIQTDTQEMDDVVPATPDSQESFTTHIGTDTGDADLPIQTGQWLYSFNGQEVEVAANGHCAFLAIYASTKNHKHGKLRVTDSTVKQATAMKAQIYATMMANLRNDVALGIVDPIAECARIFPRHPRHTSKAAVTAELFAHYAQARDRRVDKSQPTEYWAGVHELRATAQFLREPLLVLDVAASTDAHMQRYLYRDHRLDTGENHESGYVEALKDREASDYLRACFNLHVLPTFILLKRNESHFYGVGHGELYVRWQAEGDQTYADALSDAYEWKATINQLGPSEETVDFATVNLMSVTEEVNALIVKLMPQRDRLDVVHNRRGIPTLDRQNLDYNLDDLLRQEESLIHAAYGADGYAVDFTADNDDDHKYAQLPNRYIRAASGPMMEPVYARILRAKDEYHVHEADRPLLKLMRGTNRDAFMRWHQLHGGILGAPMTSKRKGQTSDLYTWLIDHHHVMRHLFAYCRTQNWRQRGGRRSIL
ncbi:hypothetical protein PF003_g35179 [Phytophthora fragariae]|nr:hypothetical protein PF003_g35179 [Phytophthora fragariae]